MTAEHDALRARAMQSLAGAGLLNVAFVGISGGLFEALARLGRGSAEELAREAGVDPGYAERWCDAAFAFELLDAEGATFALAPLGEAFRPSVEGTLMPMAVGAVLGAHMAERAAGLMRTGERPGEVVLTERPTVLPLFGPMLEAQFGPLFERFVVPAVPAFAAVDARGGLVVDLGCGNGWYLRRLARRYARLRGVGLDMFPENVAQASARAAEQGLADRLSFREGDIHRFAVDEPADLVAMSRALHHVWMERGDVLHTIREHLGAGGCVVIWEPAWPDDRAALRAPEMRGVALQNLAEHVQGNRFLRPQEIAEALRGAGFAPEVHLLAGGREAVVTGVKRA